MDRARLLRKKATEPERILWHLRNRKFAGCKFRRQHPVGGYLLDFHYASAQLAIELDGGGHTTGQAKHTIQPIGISGSPGSCLLRFWNHQIRQELDSVLRAIWLALEERQKKNPSPSSSPFAKGRGVPSGPHSRRQL